MQVSTDHDSLARWVDEYVGLGIHRTGTDVDARTVDWFSAELAAIGGRVERRPFTFDRFEATTTVAIAGEAVPSEALYYEGRGDVRSDVPRCQRRRVCPRPRCGHARAGARRPRGHGAPAVVPSGLRADVRRAVRPVGAALASADLHPLANPPQFRGDGALWAEVTDRPLLSFVGMTPYFHTPADTPDNTTSADATAIVLGAIGDATAAFLGHADRD